MHIDTQRAITSAKMLPKRGLNWDEVHFLDKNAHKKSLIGRI